MFISKKSKPRGIASSGQTNPQSIIRKLSKVDNTLSIDFDGTDEYLDIPDSDSFTFGDGSNDSAFSVSAWIYMDEATKFRIVGKTAFDTYMEWLFTTDADDDLRLVLYDSNTSNFISQKTDAVLSAGQWYHVGATYNANEANTGIVIYVDGAVAASTGANTGSYTAMHSTTADLRIGQARYSSSTSDYADGKINEVAIWSRVLKSTEMKQIYDLPRIDLNATVGQYDSNNLVGWWRMGDKHKGSAHANNDYRFTIPDVSGSLTTNRSWLYDGSNDHSKSGDWKDTESNSLIPSGDEGLDDLWVGGSTISFWIYANPDSSASSNAGIMHKAGNGNFGWAIYFDTFASSKYHFRFNQRWDNEDLIQNAHVVYPYRWNHIVVVYNADSKDNRASFYLNGSAQTFNVVSSSYDASDSTAITSDVGQHFEMGRKNTGGTYGQFMITDVAIWNTELDSDDVTAIYNSGLPNDLRAASSYNTDRSSNLLRYFRTERDYTFDVDGSSDTIKIATNPHDRIILDVKDSPYRGGGVEFWTSARRFPSVTTGWSRYGTNTMEIVSTDIGNALKFTGDGSNTNAGYAYLRAGTTGPALLDYEMQNGQVYRFTFKAKVGSGDSIDLYMRYAYKLNFNIREGYTEIGSGTADWSSTFYASCASTDWVDFECYFMPSTTTTTSGAFTYLRPEGLGDGEEVWLTDFSVKNMTPPGLVMQNQNYYRNNVEDAPGKYSAWMTNHNTANDVVSEAPK